MHRTLLLAALSLVSCGGALPQLDVDGGLGPDAGPLPQTDAGPLELDAGTVLPLDAGGEPQPDGGAPEHDAGFDAGAWSPADAGTLQPTVRCDAPSATFYEVDPAALNVSDGTVVRCEQVTAADGGALQPGRLAYRVIYKSTAEVFSDGGSFTLPVALSGQVYLPETPRTPARLVLADTHGATGMLKACAPSRAMALDATVMFSKLAALAPDAVVVVPDYQGLGVDEGYRVPDEGVQLADPAAPWTQLQPLRNVSHGMFSLEGEGRATVDLVRAARALPGAALSPHPRWLVLGVSQGGHAALSTGEVWSRGYGQDTRLLGVVAGAPTSMFESRAYIQDELERVILPMIVAGVSMNHRDVQTTRVFSTQAMAAMAKTSGAQCLSANTIVGWVTISGTYLTGASLTRGDPLADPTLVSALHANSPGFEPTAVPVFIGQVDGDPMVDARRTAQLVELERTTNPARVHSCVYPGVHQGEPWFNRYQNHDAFSFMFGGGASTCVGPDGQPTTAGVLDFVAGCLAAP